MSEDTTDSSESTGTESWVDSLPEGFADAPFIKGAKDPSDAIAQLQNAAGHMGNSLRLPGEDASTEARQEFYDKLAAKVPDVMVKPNKDNMDAFYNSMGRPEKPDEYNFEAPEGKEVPSDFGAFAQAAHKAGLNQDQFRTLIGDVLGETWTQQEIAEATQRDEMKALGEEWGQAYEQNMAQVRNFLKLTDAPEGIVDLIVNDAMSPTEIKWIHDIANQTKAPVELANIQQEQQALMTPSEAQNRIQEMLNNQEHPYWNATDPRHKDAVNKMVELQGFAHPNASRTVDDLRA